MSLNHLNKLKIPQCRCQFMSNRLLLLLISIISLSSCNGSVQQALNRTPAYEAYIQQLEKAELKDSPMAQAWIAAGQRVFKDSVLVPLPYTESGYFSAAEPNARAFRFDVKEGQVLTISGKTETPAKAKLFLDLFVHKNGQWKRIEDAVITADSSFQLVHEFREDSRGLIRLQPELLAKAYYTINLSPAPALVNPVSGASNRAIGSLYSVDRDGGRRRHEGVDIFAPKGTPVIAPTAGYISRVGSSKLGGKVVWMQDQARSQVYYFAHLDSQLVQSGKRVQQGDTLGLVGNTGNARNTPPHLHFGIYQQGSKDPIHYLRILDALPEAPPFDTSLLAKTYKVSAPKASLRTGPGEKQEMLDQLPQNTFLKIVGQSGNWYRIQLPNQQEGFLQKKQLSATTAGKPFKLQQQRPLLSEPTPGAVPVKWLEKETSLQALAQFQDFQYVETPDGLRGWISSPKTP